MLHFVRRHARSKVIWVVVALIIGVFTFWGVSAVVMGPATRAVVAMVNDHAIEAIDVQKAERNLLERYRNVYKERFTPELRKSLHLRDQALQGLIDRLVLADRARDFGLEISDKELLDVILNEPAFSRDGRFDKGLYVRILRYARQTPAEYEEGLRQDLAIQRLRDLITEGVTVSDEEARRAIIAQAERTKVSFVEFRASEFTTSFDLSEEDLRSYFEAHRDRYQRPERVRIQYVAYPPESFAEGIEVGEDEIEASYEKEKESRFTEPRQVRARHILLRVSPDASEKEKQEAREKLESWRREVVEDGADFAALAREHSEDPGSKEAGGELGWFGEGRMVKPFEEAAFALSPGEVSQVVETPFGLHLIQVEEVREARVRPLEEVREEIATELRRERARERAGAAAREDRQAAARGEDLKLLAEKRGLELREPAPQPRGGSFPGLGRSFAFTNAVWEASAGDLLEPQDVSGTWVVARVLERLPSGPLSFEEARERVETELRREKGTELARKAAEKLLASAREVGSLAQAAEEEGRELSESGEILRAGRYVPGIGGSEDLKQAIARLDEEHRLADEVFVVAGDAYVVELAERKRPSEEEIAAQLETTRKRLLERKRQQVFQSYVDGLRQQARIEVIPDRLEQVPTV